MTTIHDFTRALASTRRRFSVPRFSAHVAAALCLLALPAARGEIVFSNDFEVNANGFTASGSLTSLNRSSLPTDSGGLSSPNQSQWLGRLGFNVPKSGSQDEIVTSV